MISVAKSLFVALAFWSFEPGPAQSQTLSVDDYPNRSITIIVPAPVGGPTDLLARIIGDKLRGAFGYPSVVDNRPGAIGSIGAAAVARAEPNGYTLLCTPSAPIVLSPLINKNLPYDALSFEPIISLAQSFFVVAVRKEFPANSRFCLCKGKSKKSQLRLGRQRQRLLPDNSAAGAFSRDRDGQHSFRRPLYRLWWRDRSIF